MFLVRAGAIDMGGRYVVPVGTSPGVPLCLQEAIQAQLHALPPFGHGLCAQETFADLTQYPVKPLLLVLGAVRHRQTFSAWEQWVRLGTITSAMSVSFILESHLGSDQTLSEAW